MCVNYNSDLLYTFTQGFCTVFLVVNRALRLCKSIVHFFRRRRSFFGIQLTGLFTKQLIFVFVSLISPYSRVHCGGWPSASFSSRLPEFGIRLRDDNVSPLEIWVGLWKWGCSLGRPEKNGSSVGYRVRSQETYVESGFVEYNFGQNVG